MSEIIEGEVISSIVGSGGGGGCFRAGTQIQLEHGKTIAIELLKAGDEVLAFDEFGNIHVSKVTEVHYHENPEPLTRVKFWRGEICITPNHWVLNQYGSFVEMGALTLHDALVDGLGHLRPIMGAERIPDEPVWNLTVEPHHTFIANGVRVHNGGYRERFPAVIGAGGGGGSKGGGGGRAAVEDPDSLQSRAKISIIDLLGEGEIGGLVDGAKSIFLNDTPLMSAAGEYNFTNVSWDSRNGTPSQAVIPGFSDVESPHVVNVEVKTSTPQTFTITNPNADRVRIVMTIPQLLSQDTTTGDVHGASVSYKFQVSTNGAGFADQGSPIVISGKSRSKYQRSHVITLPKPGTYWSIKVVRITADSSTSSLVNKTYLDTYVEIIDVKLNYPNSALASVSIDPETFSSIPRRSYLVNGLYIKVPSNYNATARTYSGIWNGTFALAVSNNPAWVLYDMLTSKRYGLGNFISESQIDRAALYKIGQYCDEMVSDGLGGTEPRFVINTAFQTRAEAYKLISDITSVFRGMSYWGVGMVAVTQDSPATPTAVFSQANVVDGVFNYIGSSKKDRHSVVHVTWNDPTANYKQRVEYVEDAELVAQIGIVKLDIVAFGCTSRSQAHRAGKWLLYTERYESNMINFSAGIDASLLLPGEIVKIHDSFRAGKRMSGRLLSSTTTSATLDSPVTLSAAGAVLSIKMQDGTLVDRTVNEGIGTHSTLTWTAALSTLPVANAMFIVAEASLEPMLARVISVSQNKEQPGVFDVTAVEHNSSKYGAIENNLKLVNQPTSIIDPFANDPTTLALSESTYFVAPGVIGSKLNVSWEGAAKYFEVSYRVTLDGAVSNWQTYQTKVASYDIEGLKAGSIVDIRVQATSTLDKKSNYLDGTYTILGKTAPPSAPTGLTATPSVRSVKLQWTNPPDIDFDYVEVYMSSTNDRNTATVIARQYGDSFVVTGLPASASARYFWLKAVDTSGNKSEFNTLSGTSATTDAEADYMVGLLTGLVGSAQLAAELGARVTTGEDAAATVTSQQGKYTVKIDNNGYVTGYGLMSTANNGTPTSEFAVRADKFWISNPSGPGASSPVTPFMVLTTPTTIDGTLFNPGVYMDNAMITKLTASKIDTRGLSIKDGSGNIILAAGTALDYNNYVANKPTSVSAINTQEGLLLSSIAADFSESFDGLNAALNWENFNGSGEVAVISSSGSTYGGKVLQVGNNSGNDQVWLLHKRIIPFDATRQYRVRVRIRRVSGTGTCYLGFGGVAADGVTLVNVTGGNSYSNQHYHVAAGNSPGTTFVEYTGYTTGYGATSGDGGAGTETTPSKMHPNVRYIRPLILVNYSGAAGQYEIDSFIVESISGTTATWATLSGKPTDLAGINATEGAKLSGIADGATKNTIYRQTTAPTGGTYTTGDLWIDTDSSPTTIAQWNGSSWALVSNYTNNTNQLTDGANLGGTATWNGVTGTGKPSDNATVNNVTYSASAPASPVNGDIWVDTSASPYTAKVRVSGAWQVASNYTNNTNQLTDGAGLGTTAVWSSVTGTGKPADNATVGATSSNLTVGVGVNLLRNADFYNGSLSGWAGGTTGYLITCTVGVNLSGWFPLGGNAAWIHQNDGTSGNGGYVDLYGDNIPVIPGNRYEYQCKTGAHRCQTDVFVYFYNSANAVITNSTLSPNAAAYAGGSTLGGYLLNGGFTTAPAGAAYARFVLRKNATYSGQGDSWGFFTQAYFGEALPNQTEFSKWTGGGQAGAFANLNQITSANVSTYIASAAIGSAQIGSINLTGNFNVRSATSGQRMEMDSQVIKVFDANGVLRVKIGNLAA